MIIYSYTSLTPNILYTVSRLLPSDGRVLVKVGQKVEPHDIVGQGKRSAGFRSFSLPELLKIPIEKSKGTLRKVIGSKVYKDEVLAEIEKFWGLKKVEFHAPQDGILRDFNEETGILTFEYPPKFVQVPAGVTGCVCEIVPKKEIKIASAVARINSRLGTGKPREGALRVLGSSEIPLQPEQLDSTLSGKILVAGSFLTKEVLYKALAVRCSGMIAGGIAWKDWWALTGERGAGEDVGITVLILEGFGNLRIEKQVFEFFKENQGRYCILDGEKSEAIVPLGPPSAESASGRRGGAGKVKGIRKESDGRFGVLKEGLRVRILVPPHMHKFGKIVGVSEVEKELPSGIFAKTCKVEIGEEKVEVAVRNVEIVHAQ